MTPRDYLEIAREVFGSDKALAEAIGFSQASLVRAKALNKPTCEMAVNIEAATHGKVTRQMLRPDLFDYPAKIIKNSWR